MKKNGIRTVLEEDNKGGKVLELKGAKILEIRFEKSAAKDFEDDDESVPTWMAFTRDALVE